MSLWNALFRKVAKEDIEFGEGTYQGKAHDGSMTTLSKVNAADVPLTQATDDELVLPAGSDVEDALLLLDDKIKGIPAPLTGVDDDQVSVIPDTSDYIGMDPGQTQNLVTKYLFDKIKEVGEAGGDKNTHTWKFNQFEETDAVLTPNTGGITLAKNTSGITITVSDTSHRGLDEDDNHNGMLQSLNVGDSLAFVENASENIVDNSLTTPYFNFVISTISYDAGGGIWTITANDYSGVAYTAHVVGTIYTMHAIYTSATLSNTTQYPYWYYFGGDPDTTDGRGSIEFNVTLGEALDGSFTFNRNSHVSPSLAADGNLISPVLENLRIGDKVHVQGADISTNIYAIMTITDIVADANKIKYIGDFDVFGGEYIDAEWFFPSNEFYKLIPIIDSERNVTVVEGTQTEGLTATHVFGQKLDYAYIASKIPNVGDHFTFVSIVESTSSHGRYGKMYVKISVRFFRSGTVASNGYDLIYSDSHTVDFIGSESNNFCIDQSMINIDTGAGGSDDFKNDLGNGRYPITERSTRRITSDSYWEYNIYIKDWSYGDDNLGGTVMEVLHCTDYSKLISGEDSELGVNFDSSVMYDMREAAYNEPIGRDIDNDDNEFNYVNDLRVNEYKIQPVAKNSVTTRSQLDSARNTGILEGGLLSVNADNTKFDIANGVGIIVDNVTNAPRSNSIYVEWSDFTAQTVTNLATTTNTFIGINIAGEIVQKSVDFTPAERRTIIRIGRLGHFNKTNINVAVKFPITSFNKGGDLSDLSQALGTVNQDGNVYTPASTNLTLARSSGTSFRLGINFNNDANSPNITTSSTDSGVTFTRVYDDGTGFVNLVSGQTSIDPSKYDNGSGTLASVPNNNYSIQRVYFYPGTETTLVTYGQAVYSNMTRAKSSLLSDPIPSFDILEGSILRGAIIVKNNTTNLSDDSKAVFVGAGKLGEFGAGAIAGVTDLQRAYDNSAEPEIVTNSTNGALTVKAYDNAVNVLEVKDTSGAVKFSVGGNGDVNCTRVTGWEGLFGDLIIDSLGVDTNGGNVLLGTGILDTEGGAILTGGGNVDLEGGDLECNRITVNSTLGSSIATNGGISVSGYAGLSLFSTAAIHKHGDSLYFHIDDGYDFDFKIASSTMFEISQFGSNTNGRSSADTLQIASTGIFGGLLTASGGVDTNGGNILTGGGDIDTEGGDVNGGSASFDDLLIAHTRTTQYNKVVNVLSNSLTSGDFLQFTLGKELGVKNAFEINFGYDNHQSNDNFVTFGFYSIAENIKMYTDRSVEFGGNLTATGSISTGGHTAYKTKILTGTTDADSLTWVAHGLTKSKIRECSIMLQNNSTGNFDLAGWVGSVTNSSIKIESVPTANQGQSYNIVITYID